VLLEVGGHRILFSGDLGRPDDLLMNPPDDPPQADTVLIESTYGDRQHPQEDLWPSWAPPCSAWPRAAAWPWCRCLPWGGRRPCCTPSRSSRPGRHPARLPVFLDSPMAVHTTNLSTSTRTTTA
jgi:metallo-beta-lactamase family protein